MQVKKLFILFVCVFFFNLRKDVNLGDFDSRTPMHVAAISGNK